MRILAGACFVTFVFACGSVYAQDSLVGKWSGSFSIQTSRGEIKVGVELTIASVENGKVKGTATSYSKSCGGQYEMQGTYQDDKLALKSANKSGGAGDCWFGLKLTVDGNKLVGTTGVGSPIQLSK